MKPVDKKTMAKMLDDWKRGRPMLEFCTEYGITVHAFKIFSKGAKEMGLVRNSATKGNLLSVMAEVVNDLEKYERESVINERVKLAEALGQVEISEKKKRKAKKIKKQVSPDSGSEVSEDLDYP